MIKVYISPICIDCRNLMAILKARGIEEQFQLINITEDILLLKEFTTLRDHNPAFADKKADPAGSSIGIPAFVKEDGAISFDFDEAFAWIGQPPVQEEEIVEHREDSLTEQKQ